MTSFKANKDAFVSQYPVWQAPMAGASTVAMAVAVAQAGGMGALACAPMQAEQVRAQLKAYRGRCGQPVNVNFFAHTPPPEGEQDADAAWLEVLSGYYAEMDTPRPTALGGTTVQSFGEAHCRVLEEMRPDVVSFHFGLPGADLVMRLKRAGIKVLSTATTVEESRWLEQHGCDGVIAQGLEAGGHRGMFLTADMASQMGTMSLLPQVVDAVSVPVIAAGGIADARGVAAALALGAQAAQVGTAYLYTQEAALSDVYAQALEDGGPTAISTVFSGRPTRCRVNRLMTEQGPFSELTPAFPKGFAAMGPLREAAEAEGRADFSAHYCGQSAALCRKTSAHTLTRALMEGAGDRGSVVSFPGSSQRRWA